MNSKIGIICIMLLLVLFSCGEDEPERPPVVPDNYEFDEATAQRPIDLNPDEWELDEDLSDQFGSANIRSNKWLNNIDDFGPWSWHVDNTYQEDDILNIRMRYEEHTDRGMDMFYKTGIIRSLDTISYGYVEAKIKGMPTFPAASPAFWLNVKSDDLSDWGLLGDQEGDVQYAEIDVVELQQGNWDPDINARSGPKVMDCNLHYSTIQNGQTVRVFPNENPDLLKTKYTAPWDPRDDYHTYGAHVTPQKITFYIDGQPISEKDNLYWHLPMRITVSLGLRYPHVTYNNCPNGLTRCPVPSAATEDGFPSSMKVDWVRTYRKK